MPTGSGSASSIPARRRSRWCAARPTRAPACKGVFAPPGTVIPRTGAVLKETMIRGVASRGMLCSAFELGLGEDHEGIIEVPPDAPIGARYADLIGLDDPVIDIKVTPNRGDCLGVRGIARDLAASGLGRLKPLDATAGAGPLPLADRRRISRTVRPARCFSAAIFAGCATGRAPIGCAAGSKRSGCGRSRPLVDITNFLTFDLGRPLHVFDAEPDRGRPHRALGAPSARPCWR